MDRALSPYAPLDASQRQTRLLSIATKDGMLTCNLHTVSLMDNEIPQFTALSYVWGDPTPTEAIVLNGNKALITPALLGALKSVTKHWKKIFPHRDIACFRLWVCKIYSLFFLECGLISGTGRWPLHQPERQLGAKPSSPANVHTLFIRRARHRLARFGHA